MGQAKQQEVKWQWLGLNVGCQRHTLVLLLSGFLQQPPVQITEDELLASIRFPPTMAKRKGTASLLWLVRSVLSSLNGCTFASPGGSTIVLF